MLFRWGKESPERDGICSRLQNWLVEKRGKEPRSPDASPEFSHPISLVKLLFKKEIYILAVPHNINYHRSPYFYSQAYTPENYKQVLNQVRVHTCSHQHHSQQPKDPPRGQYTNNLHHVLVCTMTHYSDVERDVLIHATVCMNPEGIRSLTEWSHLYEISNTGKSTGTGHRVVVTRGRGEEGG